MAELFFFYISAAYEFRFPARRFYPPGSYNRAEITQPGQACNGRYLNPGTNRVYLEVLRL